MNENPFNIISYEPMSEFNIEIVREMAELCGTRATAVNRYHSNGGFPGGMVIVEKDIPIALKVKNNIDEATTVHWHGLEVPNAQDNPDLVILPGEQHDFRFTLSEPGSYWYHPHLPPVLPQLNSGLYAPFIVKDAYDAQYAGDYVLMLDDWSLSPDGGIDAAYSTSGMEVIGNVETVNYKSAPHIPPIMLKAGEIIKLRFLNASTAQTHTLSLPGHTFRVTHLDGYSLPEPFMTDSIRLAPGERVDVELKGAFESGVYEITNGRGLGISIPVLYKGKGRGMHSPFVPPPSRSFGEAIPPHPDFKFVLNSRMAKGASGGMNMGGTHHAGSMDDMGGMSESDMGGTHDMKGSRVVWSINGDSYPHTRPVVLQTGRVYRLRFKNEDMMQMEDNMTHPIHIHGAHFEVVSLNGAAPSREMFKDTLEVAPNEYADIAVRFSNPGQWMLHCHIIDHEDNGMMMMLDFR